MEKFDIVIRLKCQLSKHSQGVSGYIFLDDDILGKYHCDASQDWEQRFTVNINAGTHKFGFTVNDKQSADTVVDAAGTILDDTLITLDYFEIDEIELTEMYKLRGKFIHANQSHDPEINTAIGHNGSYFLEFDTPYYEWLLANI